MEGIKCLDRGVGSSPSWGWDRSMVWTDPQHAWIHRHHRGDGIGRARGSTTSTCGCLRSVVWLDPIDGGGERLRGERSREGREDEVHRVRGCDPSIEGVRSQHGGDAVTPWRGCRHAMEGMRSLHRGDAITPSRGWDRWMEGTRSLLITGPLSDRIEVGITHAP
jgi:hypothetical protein